METKTKSGGFPWLHVAMAAITALGLWLTLTSFTPGLNHGRLTQGLLLLWLAAFWVRALMNRLWDILFPRAEDKSNGKARLPVNLFLSLAPGLILTWFGIYGPDEPTLTRGGFDVCELSVGYCVSGTRAFIFFGGIILVIGLIIAYSQIKKVLSSS